MSFLTLGWFKLKLTLNAAKKALYPRHTSHSLALRLGHAPFGEKMAWMDLSEMTWWTVRDDSPLLLYDTRAKNLGTASLDFISPILPATSNARPVIQDQLRLQAQISNPVVESLRVTYRYYERDWEGGISVSWKEAAGLLPETYEGRYVMILLGHVSRLIACFILVLGDCTICAGSLQFGKTMCYAVRRSEGRQGGSSTPWQVYGICSSDPKEWSWRPHLRQMIDPSIE